MNQFPIKILTNEEPERDSVTSFFHPLLIGKKALRWLKRVKLFSKILGFFEDNLQVCVSFKWLFICTKTLTPKNRGGYLRQKFYVCEVNNQADAQNITVQYLCEKKKI